MRVAVIGGSGSGKTTFGRRLGEALGIPFVELDAVTWQAGWRDLVTHEPLIARLASAQDMGR